MAQTRLAELDDGDARAFRHIPALDGIRGMAIIFVLLLHFSAPWRRDETGLFSGGYIGVDVFFVLSGFLITSLLVDEQSRYRAVSFGSFYARRALRLLPALMTLLVVHLVVVALTTGDTALEAKWAVAIFFYVSNLVRAFHALELTNASLSFAWSLSIEEHFYFVWPALLMLVVVRLARTRRAVLVTVVGLALASTAVRSFTWLVQSDYTSAYLRTDCRLDGLLIGAAAAFAWRWRLLPARLVARAAPISLTVLVAAALFGSRPGDVMFTIGFTAVSAAAALLILAIADDVPSLTPFFASAPMRLIGRVSYGLYLWHGLGLWIAFRVLRLDHGPFPLAALGLVLTVGAVATSWFVVEQPALRLKRRFERVPLHAKPFAVAR